MSINVHVCTYPKWAIGHVGSSPDNRNCVFDWFNWHIGTGKHTIGLALYLDINRVSISILKSSKYKQRVQALEKCLYSFNSPRLFQRVSSFSRTAAQKYCSEMQMTPL